MSTILDQAEYVKTPKIPIFTHECIEHGKVRERSVWLMDFSAENLRKLWENSKEHRVLFSDDINGDFEAFCNIFISQDNNYNLTANGLVWIVDDFVGVLFMSEIKSKEAKLDFSFFDGRLRLDISKRMVEYLFETYDFERLNVQIVPFASKKVFNFLGSLGFVQEGIKRKSLTYKNQKFDMLLYGLLREEFEDKWDSKKEQ